MTVDQEVARQIVLDASWATHHPGALFNERLRALAGAQRELAGGDQAAVYAVRQGLIDDVAAATKAAEILPAPRVSRD